MSQQKKIIFRVHAINRMFQRGLGYEEVKYVIDAGEMIEVYPNDFPYPSRLILGWYGARPLHVVVAENLTDKEIIVITVYEPDSLHWDSDFKRRLL